MSTRRKAIATMRGRTCPDCSATMPRSHELTCPALIDFGKVRAADAAALSGCEPGSRRERAISYGERVIVARVTGQPVPPTHVVRSRVAEDGEVVWQLPADPHAEVSS